MSVSWKFCRAPWQRDALVSFRRFMMERIRISPRAALPRPGVSGRFCGCMKCSNSFPPHMQRNRKQNSGDSAQEEKGLDKRHEIIGTALPEVYKIAADIGHGKGSGNGLHGLGQLVCLYSHHAGENHEGEVKAHSDAKGETEFSAHGGN